MYPSLPKKSLKLRASQQLKEGRKSPDTQDIVCLIAQKSPFRNATTNVSTKPLPHERLVKLFSGASVSVTSS